MGCRHQWTFACGLFFLFAQALVAEVAIFEWFGKPQGWTVASGPDIAFDVGGDSIVDGSNALEVSAEHSAIIKSEAYALARPFGVALVLRGRGSWAIEIVDVNNDVVSEIDTAKLSPETWNLFGAEVSAGEGEGTLVAALQKYRLRIAGNGKLFLDRLHIFDLGAGAPPVPFKAVSIVLGLSQAEKATRFIVYSDESPFLNYAVSGGRPGMRLRLDASNAFGESWLVGLQPIGRGDADKGIADVMPFSGERAFGPLAVEARLVGPDGNAFSRTERLVISHLKRPASPVADAADSRFSLSVSDTNQIRRGYELLGFRRFQFPEDIDVSIDPVIQDIVAQINLEPLSGSDDNRVVTLQLKASDVSPDIFDQLFNISPTDSVQFSIDGILDDILPDSVYVISEYMRLFELASSQEKGDRFIAVATPWHSAAMVYLPDGKPVPKIPKTLFYDVRGNPVSGNLHKSEGGRIFAWSFLPLASLAEELRSCCSGKGDH